jgi:hypothetical protein
MVGVVFDGRGFIKALIAKSRTQYLILLKSFVAFLLQIPPTGTFCRFTRFIGALPSIICGLPASWHEEVIGSIPVRSTN